MSTTTRARGASAAGNGRALWEDRTRVVLQPVAAPDILGLFGFAAALFVLGAYLAGWFGDATSPRLFFPFVALIGGLAQQTAARWAYQARDGLATAVHGLWGAFFLAYGLLFLLVAAGAIDLPNGDLPELGWWFLPLAVFSLIAAFAALAQNVVLALMLGTLFAGSAFTGVFYLTGNGGWDSAGGWTLIAAAILAAYAAAAALLESTWGRVVLPLGRPRVRANVPGRRVAEPLGDPTGMPGLRQGQ